MTEQLTEEQLESLHRMSPDQRYEHLVRTVTEQGELWILHDDDGFVMVGSEAEQCLPVWPHAQCADAWATEEWAGCAPRAIDLETWRSRWSPGLEGDEILVAVFPRPDGDVVVESAPELTESLDGVDSRGS